MDEMNPQPTQEQARTVFEIPDCNMENLAAKITVLNKKAKRLKLEPIVTKVLSVERREQTEQILIGEDETGNAKFRFYKFWRTYFTVEILGASPVLPDWEFLGTLEHHEAGNILRSFPGSEIPEQYRQASKKCDHCQKIRSRKNTYIVRNKVTSDIKQVGHNCVHDFLGHVSPQRLALFAEFIREMQEIGTGGGSGERSVHIAPLLEMVAACALEKGFISRAAAQNYLEKSEGRGGVCSTADQAWNYLFPTPEMKKRGDLIHITDEARRLAQEVIQWVNEGHAGTGNYGHNLKIAFTLDYITRKQLGIAASAVGSYQKAMGKQREYQAKEKYGVNSQHFGEVGKREVFTVKVTGEHAFPSQFGTTILFRMEDFNGNICVWWTGNNVLEIGKTYQVKATVKKHDLYKEIRQTVLTRISIIQEVENKSQVQPEGGTNEETVNSDIDRGVNRVCG